jgi:hypothetical protein
MMLQERYSDLYHYESFATMHMGRFNEAHPIPSICHLRLLQGEDSHAVAILTERADNPGKSVTNAATEVASRIVADFGLDPTITTFIEHYTQESYSLQDGELWETYDLMTFTWSEKVATMVEWRRLQPQELAELGVFKP